MQILPTQINGFCVDLSLTFAILKFAGISRTDNVGHPGNVLTY